MELEDASEVDSIKPIKENDEESVNKKSKDGDSMTMKAHSDDRNTNYYEEDNTPMYEIVQPFPSINTSQNVQGIKIVSKKVKDSELNGNNGKDTVNTTQVTIQARCIVEMVDNEIDLHETFTRVVGRLLIQPGVTLIPFNPSEINNSIQEAPQIPTNKEEFDKFCHEPHLSYNEKNLFFMFKLELWNTSFWKIKTQAYNWLVRQKVFMFPTNLKTGKNCTIGWLLNSHPRLTIRRAITEELKERLNKDIPFQLIPRTIFNKNSNSRTEALNIECAVKDADDLTNSFMEAFAIKESKYLFRGTKKMLFIPNRPTKEINSLIISNSINIQNEFLKHTRRIPVLSKIPPGTKVTTESSSQGTQFNELLQRQIPNIESIISDDDKMYIFVKAGNEESVIKKMEDINDRTNNNGKKPLDFQVYGKDIKQEVKHISTRRSYAEILTMRNSLALTSNKEIKETRKLRPNTNLQPLPQTNKPSAQIQASTQTTKISHTIQNNYHTETPQPSHNSNQTVVHTNKENKEINKENTSQNLT